MTDTGGNQCGLIFSAHAPCAIEMQGHEPDEDKCPIVARWREIFQRRT